MGCGRGVTRFNRKCNGPLGVTGLVTLLSNTKESYRVAVIKIHKSQLESGFVDIDQTSLTDLGDSKRR